MKFLRLLTDSVRQWFILDLGHHAAAFSYYAPFALVPLVLFSVGILSYFYGATFVKTLFFNWGTLLGPDLLELLNTAVQNLDTEVQTYDLPLLGGIFFLSVTVFAFNTLASGFMRVYGEPLHSFRTWLLQTLRSLVLVVTLQFFFIFIITLEGLWAQLSIPGLGFIPPLVWLLSISCLFAVIYRYLVPSAPSMAGCTVGGIVTGLLFIIAKYLVSFYIAAKPVVSIFGAAGLILILLIWIYVLAAIMYYGSIVAKGYDTMHKRTIR
jgi:membrane protein